jgi:hypothetical protein
MGYTVLVRRKGVVRTRDTIFSENISHNAMRTALTSALRVAQAESAMHAEDGYHYIVRVPVHLLTALAPGQNGVSLTRKQVRADRHALREFRDTLDCIDHPMVWVLDVLLGAFHWCDEFGGEVVFD